MARVSEWRWVLEILGSAGAGGALLAYARRVARKRAAHRRLLIACAEAVIEACAGVVDVSQVLHGTNGTISRTELASRRALLHNRMQRAKDKVTRCKSDLH